MCGLTKESADQIKAAGGNLNALNGVQRYLHEPIIVGGLPTTRGAFIREMTEAGHPRRCIDIYLMGLDTRTALAKAQGE